MAEKPAPLAWITVQLNPPPASRSWAAFVEGPEQKVRVEPIAYFALQHLRYDTEPETEEEEPIEELESRIVPLTIDSAGIVVELDEVTPGFVGLGEDEVAAKRIGSNYAEAVKATINRAAATTTTTSEKGPS